MCADRHEIGPGVGVIVTNVTQRVSATVFCHHSPARVTLGHGGAGRIVRFLLRCTGPTSRPYIRWLRTRSRNTRAALASSGRIASSFPARYPAISTTRSRWP